MGIVRRTVKTRDGRLSRRLFLGGAGALVGLPALESLVPRPARADDHQALRVLAFYVPNGIHMAAWTPVDDGPGYTLSPILAPLANVKSKVLVLSGLSNKPSRPDGPGDHAAGTAGFLTCRHVVKTEGANIQNGVSMDQVAASVLAEATTIGSLQLGIDGGAGAGDCDSGYSCAYARNISWASATQPLPKTVNPQVVWDMLFGGLDPEATEEQKQKRILYRTSILDHVHAEATTLRGRLGQTDRRKLDEYLDGVFELEQKIVKASLGPACTPGERPPADLPYPEHVRLMCDLMVLALQCDSTRVVSFMLGNAGSGRSYGFLEVPEGHHELSHHQDLQENFDKLTTIDTWEVAQLAYLLERMDAVVEADGSTLLDNSAVFFSSEIEDGNSHAHVNLPVLLAGGLGGALGPGRHLRFSNEEPVANLFTTVLQAVGADVSTFGDDGTGPLALG